MTRSRLWVGDQELEVVMDVSPLLGLPAVRDPFNPDTYYVGPIAREINVDFLFQDGDFYEQFAPKPPLDWTVRFALGRLTMELPKLSLAMCEYGGALHGTNRAMQDLEWRFHWYVDPGAAWWER